VCSPKLAHPSEGRPYARFRRALEARSVLQAETAARELGRLGLNDALDYLTLLGAEDPERFERAARKWLALLLAESPALTLDEVTVALGCLRGIGALYEEPSREVLRALVKRRHHARGQWALLVCHDRETKRQAVVTLVFIAGATREVNRVPWLLPPVTQSGSSAVSQARKRGARNRAIR
jgi:hypothetical protein